MSFHAYFLVVFFFAGDFLAVAFFAVAFLAGDFFALGAAAFFGLLFDQLAAAIAKRALWSREGLDFFSFSSSLPMKMLYADGARFGLSAFFSFLAVVFLTVFLTGAAFFFAGDAFFAFAILCLPPC